MKVTNSLEMTEIEKLKSLPISVNEAYNDLTVANSNGIKSSIIEAVYTARLIITAMKEFGIDKIDPLLKCEKWTNLFKLPIEDRQIKNHFKTSNFLIMALESGIQIPPSKIIPYVSLLEKKEYRKIVAMNIKEISLAIMDGVEKIDMIELLNSKFNLLPTPTIENSITEIQDYKIAQIAIEKSKNDIAIERSKPVQTATKERSRSFTETEFRVLLQSFGKTESESKELTTYYFTK